MAVVNLPVDSEDDTYSFGCQLDGVQFNFDFFWNDRDLGWWFTISDASSSPIYSGKVVVTFWDLLAYCPDARRPLGAILAVDTTGADLDPGRGDLGTRVHLNYVEVISMGEGTIVRI